MVRFKRRHAWTGCDGRFRSHSHSRNRNHGRAGVLMADTTRRKAGPSIAPRRRPVWISSTCAKILPTPGRAGFSGYLRERVGTEIPRGDTTRYIAGDQRSNRASKRMVAATSVSTAATPGRAGCGGRYHNRNHNHTHSHDARKGDATNCKAGRSGVASRRPVGIHATTATANVCLPPASTFCQVDRRGSYLRDFLA